MNVKDSVVNREEFLVSLNHRVMEVKQNVSVIGCRLDGLNQTLVEQNGIMESMNDRLHHYEVKCFGKEWHYPDQCSGHGECVDVDQCDCHFNWTGNECNVERFVWTEVDTDPKPSKGRHAMIVSYNESLWLFGGRHESSFRHELWKFQIDTEVWINVTPDESPPARFAHSSVVYHDIMIVFGGSNSGGYRNDLWTFNFSTLSWNEVSIANPKPGIRHAHSAVIYKDAMWIFGGRQSNHVFLNDFWCLNIMKSWTSKSTQPPARRGHIAVVYEDAMWIYGGYDANSHLKEMWMFNFTMESWDQISLPSNLSLLPPALYLSAVVYEDILWTFGGRQGSYITNKVWNFHFADRSWKMIDTLDAPIPRYGHAFEAHEGILWIFGGIDGLLETDIRDDLWKFTL